MLFEIEDETRDFATEQKKEFGPKKICNLFKAKPFYPEYINPNPIIEAYKEYLNTEQKNNSLPVHLRTETATKNLQKLQSERPHLKFLSRMEPLNETLIELDKEKLLKSTYQLEYFAKNLGDHGSLGQKKPRSQQIILSNDSLIPETIQKKSYRDPRQFCTGNLVSRKYNGPSNNLGVNEKEREILRNRRQRVPRDYWSRRSPNHEKKQFHGPAIPIEPPEEHKKS